MARILIVEDDNDTRMVLGKFLGVAGHEIVPAANGWEALLVLDKSNVDLILLDMMMPGMDGATFLQILRQAKKHKQLPVVLITALDPADAEKRTRNFEVWQILPKTERLLDELTKTVQQIVGRIESSQMHPGETG